MTDYEFHMSTIDSWVFEERKTVTYKYLAHSLSISSNYAKQMLFDFMTRNGNKAKSTYFISGLAKSDQTLRIHIVKDSRLDDVERKFETIISKHLYSVAPTELADSAQLWAADRELPPYSPNSTVDDWSTIHEGSSIKTSFIEKRVKLLKKAPSAPIAPLSRAPSQSQSGLVTRASSTLSENESSQKDSPFATPPALLKTPSSAKPAAKKSSIMGMFAASAAKAPKAASTPVKSEIGAPPSASSPANTNQLPKEGTKGANQTEMAVKSEKTEEEGTGPFSPAKKTSKSPTNKKSLGKKTTSAKKSTSPGTKTAGGSLQKIDMFAKKSIGEAGDLTDSQHATPQENRMDIDEPLPEVHHEAGNAMEVTDSLPSRSAAVKEKSVPKSLEDDLLEELEASDGESGKLSKLKKNVLEESDTVFDTDEDPFGATSKSAKVARAKKQEEAKQQAKKEAAEARKKARAEAKAKKAEEEANEAEDVEEKGKKRRKRNAAAEADKEGEEAPAEVTEQRRRFDAYFGASSQTAASGHGDHPPNALAMGHSTILPNAKPIFDIPTTRTRTVVDIESFVNEKGYTVTREVERTVEEAISPEEQQKMREEAEAKHKKQMEADQARREAEAKRAAAKASATAKAAAAPAAKKSSIMSFFGKN
jgi:hypothetical protein